MIPNFNLGNKSPIKNEHRQIVGDWTKIDDQHLGKDADSNNKVS
jgi:hypothetical protein